ncbi:MAG TPA: gluconate 2-dehydrogenase subunit 3 family protein [Caulobacterales bacterium]|nr:gluconate 2-dehydrogenase subunit 3 family protein [Caulobacterales bacterium]
MPDPGESRELHRRALLQRAIILVGGAAALAGLEGCDFAHAQFFSANQRAKLDRICDIIIPATDTPGALGAGVPAFIDAMMTHWASRETRRRFVSVLDEVEARAHSVGKTDFLALTPQQQIDVVTAYDRDQMLGPGQNYRPFKNLLLLGYYHSQIGATQELHYELVPGHWIADAPLSSIGRTWA